RLALFLFLPTHRAPRSTLFPYTTLFRSVVGRCEYGVLKRDKPFLLRYYPKAISGRPDEVTKLGRFEQIPLEIMPTFAKDSITLTDRKSTRLNSSHVSISYAVFCLKKKKK